MKRRDANNELDELAEMHGQLNSTIQSLSANRMSFIPAKDAWSPHQILGHLVDAEIAFCFRIRKVIAEDNPSYPSFDEEKWVTALHHDMIPISMLLATWNAMRELNINLLRTLDSSAWDRSGIHDINGAQSLPEIVRSVRIHDVYHMKQLKSVDTGGD